MPKKLPAFEDHNPLRIAENSTELLGSGETYLTEENMVVLHDEKNHILATVRGNWLFRRTLNKQLPKQKGARIRHVNNFMEHVNAYRLPRGRSAARAA